MAIEYRATIYFIDTTIVRVDAKNNTELIRH